MRKATQGTADPDGPQMFLIAVYPENPYPLNGGVKSLKCMDVMVFEFYEIAK